MLALDGGVIVEPAPDADLVLLTASLACYEAERRGLEFRGGGGGAAAVEHTGEAGCRTAQTTPDGRFALTYPGTAGAGRRPSAVAGDTGPDMRAVLVATLRVIARAHAAGVAHTDLRPECIVRGGGSVALVVGWSRSERFEPGEWDPRIVWDLRALALCVLGEGAADAGRDPAHLSRVYAELPSRCVTDPGLVPVLERMLACGAQGRYRRADEALLALDAEDRQHPEPTPQGFVGRRPELAELSFEAAEVANKGGVTTVAVFGAPGIGKTRLCAEFAEVHAASGGIVAHVEVGAGAQSGALELSGQVLGTASTSGPGDLVRGLLREAAGRRTLVLMDGWADATGSARGYWNRFLSSMRAATHELQPRVLIVCIARSRADVRTDVRGLSELPPLTRSQTTGLLISLMGESGSVALLGARLHTASGGVPGVVQEVLHEWVRDGIIEWRGRYWEHAATCSSGLVSDPPRRDEGVDPDATGLHAPTLLERECVEVVACSDCLGLTTRDVAGIVGAEHAAAEAALESLERCGQVKRTGRLWSLSDGAIRRRICGAVSTHRLRIMHRSIAATLAARGDTEATVLRRHRLASGDPDAWVDVEGFLTSLSMTPPSPEHPIIARLVLDDDSHPCADPRLRTLAAEVLTSCGELALADCTLSAVLRDASATGDEKALAVAARGRLLRLGQQQRGLTQIELPSDCADVQLRAEVRLLRAVGHAVEASAEFREREVRLALAELGGVEPCRRVRGLLLYVEALGLKIDGRSKDALPIQLRAVRLFRAEGMGILYRLGVDFYAGLLFGSGRYFESLQCIRFAQRRFDCESRAGVSDPLLPIRRNWTGLCLDALGFERAASRAFESATCAAHRMRLGKLAVAYRLRVIARRASNDALLPEDEDFVRVALETFGGGPGAPLEDLGPAAMVCAFYFGHLDLLERCCSRLIQSRSAATARSAALRYAGALRLLVGDAVDSDMSMELDRADAGRASSFQPTSSGDSDESLDDRSPWSRSTVLGSMDQESVGLEVRRLRFGRRVTADMFGEWELALAALLELLRRGATFPPEAGHLTQRLRARGLPLPLEWKRWCFLAALAGSTGDKVGAGRCLAEATIQSLVLRSARCGSVGRRLEQVAAKTAGSLSLAPSPPEVPQAAAEARVELEVVPRPPLRWTHLADTAVAGKVGIIRCTSADDAFAFVRHILEMQPSLDVRWPEGSPSVLAGRRIVVALPELWRPAELAVQFHGSISGGRPPILVTAESTLGSARSPRIVRSMVELHGKRSLELPRLTDLRREDPLLVLPWRASKVQPDLVLSKRECRLLAAHPWGPGLAALDEALAWLAGLEASDARGSELQRRLASMLEVDRRAKMVPRVREHFVLSCFQGDRRVSAAEIASATGIPLRSVQRELLRLLSLGTLQREGTTKLARYWSVAKRGGD